ncbi:uncharacterized protein G2W53_025729 [Senna tora]|uniref:Uncharacterized protein n=1 Tax=Senna tora TaxID=362788 RepID=A0A834TMR9_9FABA|nr:uncharacterized protein G2W53_025729 [Senna tora]
MYELWNGKGHRKEEHPSRPIASESNNGVHPDGHNLHPPLRRSSRSNKQHIQREESPKRRRILLLRFREHRTISVAKVRDAFNLFPILLLLSHSVHKIREPIERLNNLHATGGGDDGNDVVFEWGSGEGDCVEHRGE